MARFDMTLQRSVLEMCKQLNENIRGSGVTSYRQPRQCQGAEGPKMVKGAQSDPNYVSRRLLDCVPVSDMELGHIL